MVQHLIALDAIAIRGGTLTEMLSPITPLSNVCIRLRLVRIKV